MGLEEASGLKEARKERNSIIWAMYEIEKRKRAAKGRRRPKVMQTKKVRGLWQAHKSQG